MTFMPEPSDLRDDFAEVLAAISAPAGAGPGTAMAEPLAAMAKQLRGAFMALAPHGRPMAPRKAQARDIAVALSACAEGRAVFSADADARSIIAIMAADAPGAAALLTDGASLAAGRAAATALELRLVRLLVEDCAKAAGLRLPAAELPAAAVEAMTGWHGVAVALAEARGRGGAPVLWGLMRLGDTASPVIRSGSDDVVRRRLGQAEASLTHSASLGRKPFGLLQAMREGDEIELGRIDDLILTGHSNGQPVHLAVPVIRDGRMVARVTGLLENEKSGLNNG